MMNPLVIFGVALCVLSVAIWAWMLATSRQVKIRKLEMDDAAKTLQLCSDGFKSLGRRWSRDAGKLIEANQIITAIKGTDDAYNKLSLELKTRIDLFLKRRKVI